MNITCSLGIHKWAGCKCKKCEKTRDVGHNWGEDCEECTECGAGRQNAHSWAGCKCSACGKVRNEGHDWRRWNEDCSQCHVCNRWQVTRLPDVTHKPTDVDLFQLLGDQPIALNVASMFSITRRVVGGRIGLVDLYFENGIVLWNVRITGERVITIPNSYRVFPIKSVGVPDLERHREDAPIRAELRS